MALSRVVAVISTGAVYSLAAAFPSVRGLDPSVVNMMVAPSGPVIVTATGSSNEPPSGENAGVATLEEASSHSTVTDLM